MSRNLVSLILLLFSISLPASACRMLPIEKNVERYIYDLVKGTPDIYLAEAESFSKDDESVTLKVKEVIRGEKKTASQSPAISLHPVQMTTIFTVRISFGKTFLKAAQPTALTAGLTLLLKSEANTSFFLKSHFSPKV